MVPWVFLLRDRNMPDDTDLQEVLTLVRSVDRKLDTLLRVLAEEDEEDPTRTLDGEQAGAERDTTLPL